MADEKNEKRKTRAVLSGSTFKKNSKVVNRAENGVAEVRESTVGEQGALVNQGLRGGEAVFDSVAMQARSRFFNQAVGKNAAADARELDIEEDVVIDNIAVADGEEEAQSPDFFPKMQGH